MNVQVMEGQKTLALVASTPSRKVHKVEQVEQVENRPAGPTFQGREGQVLPRDGKFEPGLLDTGGGRVRAFPGKHSVAGVQESCRLAPVARAAGANLV